MGGNIAHQRRRLARACLSFVLFVVAASAGRAETVAEFYAGRTISFVVGSATGGTFDVSARVVSRFLPKFIPGNPTIIVQNMPGASHVRATEYLANIAPRDGAAIAFVQPSVILNKVTSPAAKYNPAEMTWIGRIAPVRNVGFAVSEAGVPSIAASRERELIMGAAGSTGPAAMVPWALNRMIGAKLRLVRGYTDDTATLLAVERREIMGMGSINYASLLRHAGWIESGKVKLLYAIAASRMERAPETPSIVELVSRDADKAVMNLIASIPAVGITLMGAPGIPADRAEVLRAAATAMFRDPAFIAEMGKMELDVDPLGGAETAALVGRVMRTPDAIVEDLKRQTAPID